jgi:TonB family protein
MRLVIVLLCCALAFGQDNASTPQANRKAQANDSGLGVGAPGNQFDAFDILSDTEGVDFRPYLKESLKDIRKNWYRLIPENAAMKEGKLAIEFAITPDGSVADMKLVASSGDVALDRAAWGSITASNPFKPLPAGFTKPFLALRFRFYYNYKADSGVPDKHLTDPARGATSETRVKPKSSIKVSISAPTDLRVPVGGSKVMTALVTGAGSQDNTVEWSVSAFGCSGAACGEMTRDSYHAPAVMPNPPFVTLTATSKADPSAKASVIVHIFDDHSQR